MEPDSDSGPRLLVSCEECGRLHPQESPLVLRPLCASCASVDPARGLGDPGFE